jgi:phosphoribosyl 1,2-cyclic phosphodiesterase
MRFVSLGSGSRGNSLIVEAGKQSSPVATRVMLDCGFTLKETTARLAKHGLATEQLTGIVVTHEHADHVAGVFRLARRYRLPVWLTHGTWSAVLPRLQGLGIALDDLSAVNLIDSHSPFVIGDLALTPFPVPHDAREPVQFVFADGRHRLGVLTDVGTSTPHIASTLGGCDALLLECNHDPALLAANDRYPPPLKRRIAGRMGHLANAAAAQLLSELDCSRLQHLVAAHLSEENNTPALAVAALSACAGKGSVEIGVAPQQGMSAWCELE